MFSELKKFSRPIFSELKKNSWPTIGLICVFGFLLGFGGFLFLPKLWPGGIGIGKDESVTTTTVETIEKDKQGKTVKKVTITAHNDGKTLWDWGSLLGVPLSLAILGYFLQQQQQKRAETLSKEQRDIADNETKEEVLQTYFDRLSVLLIDRNLIALSNKSQSSTIKPEEQQLLDSSLDVIRARTLSILRRFESDAKGKGSVMNFLIETRILGKSKLNLSEANLSGANLSGANLSGANLSEAYLTGANLSEADLSKAYLSKAYLYEAYLYGANLSAANLSAANLSAADLSMANLSGADLSMANLSGANLSGADLSVADLSFADLYGADLSVANLSGTMWPDKSKFANAINIPEELKKRLDIP